MLLFLLSTMTQGDPRKNYNVKKKKNQPHCIQVLAWNNVFQAGRDTEELSTHSTDGNVLPQHRLQTMTEDLISCKDPTC